MGILKDKIKRKERRIKRIRKKIFGTKAKPRVAFSQSNKHLYAQAINDTDGKTLAFICSQSKDLKLKTKSKKNMKIAGDLAEKFFEKLENAKIKQIVLDRRNKQYHGIVKAFSDKLREKGVKF